MSDDRLADLLATELEVRHGTCATWGAHIANAIRAAVAADPSIVGMERVAGKHHRGSAKWAPHRFYDCVDDPCECSLLYGLAPSEGEATR